MSYNEKVNKNEKGADYGRAANVRKQLCSASMKEKCKKNSGRMVTVLDLYIEYYGAMCKLHGDKGGGRGGEDHLACQAFQIMFLWVERSYTQIYVIYIDDYVGLVI